MKISYAITVHNEHKELKTLLEFLFNSKRKEDEIVLQMDKTATDLVWDVAESFEAKMQANEYKHSMVSLDKNFAKYKNILNSKCTGDWIFQIDADEIPNEYLIKALQFILEANSEIEEILEDLKDKMAELTQEAIDQIENIMYDLIQGLKQ